MWLSLGSIQQPIEALLLEMLKPQQSNPVLQQAVLEELDRPAKHSEVVFEYLGLREVGRDLESEVPLVLVSPKFERNPWREALLQPGGDCPIGVVVNTSDHGRLVLIHEVFAEFSEPQKALVRQYAALATKGERLARIVVRLQQCEQERPGRRHEQGGGKPVAGDIPDHEGDGALGERVLVGSRGPEGGP